MCSLNNTTWTYDPRNAIMCNGRIKYSLITCTYMQAFLSPLSELCIFLLLLYKLTRENAMICSLCQCFLLFITQAALVHFIHMQTGTTFTGAHTSSVFQTHTDRNLGKKWRKLPQKRETTSSICDKSCNTNICDLTSVEFTSSSRSLVRKFLSWQWYSNISGDPTDFSVASSNSILDILANSPTFSWGKQTTDQIIIENHITVQDEKSEDGLYLIKTGATDLQQHNPTWGRNWQRLLTWMCRFLTSSSTDFWLLGFPLIVHSDWLFRAWISLAITTLPARLNLCKTKMKLEMQCNCFHSQGRQSYTMLQFIIIKYLLSLKGKLKKKNLTVQSQSIL